MAVVHWGGKRWDWFIGGSAGCGRRSFGPSGTSQESPEGPWSIIGIGRVSAGGRTVVEVIFAVGGRDEVSRVAGEEGGPELEGRYPDFRDLVGDYHKC